MAGQRMHPSPYMEVSAVCTHPDFRGMGYAKALMLHVMKIILDNSFTPFLHVLSNNSNAIELYKTIGFRTREQIFVDENRIMIQSPKVATYDLKPSMSANEVKDAVVKEMNSTQPDFICLNFANPDMVGHTGIYDAAIKAVETTDKAIGLIYEACKKNNYILFVFDLEQLVPVF
jgi:predicted acetyltransferase